MLSSGAVFVSTVLILSSALVQGSQSKPQKSLGFSCLRRSFISVAASTPKRDRIPSVQLELTDPAGRSTGADTNGQGIPSSRYAEVVELPQAPNRSKAIAVEVCEAEQGVYQVQVHEVGLGQYLLSIRALWTGAADNMETLVQRNLGNKGRTRGYKFIYRIEDRQIVVRWLDEQGRELDRLEHNEW